MSKMFNKTKTFCFDLTFFQILGNFRDIFDKHVFFRVMVAGWQNMKQLIKPMIYQNLKVIVFSI